MSACGWRESLGCPGCGEVGVEGEKEPLAPLGRRTVLVRSATLGGFGKVDMMCRPNVLALPAALPDASQAYLKQHLRSREGRRKNANWTPLAKHR